MASNDVADAAALARETVPVGLALGGLAGNNAHGAGVLQAALDCNLQPNLISCTSGQIHWVYRYLRARKEAPRRGALRRELRKLIRGTSPTGVEAIDAWWVALAGAPGVVRLALAEFPLHVLSNLSEALARTVTRASTNWRSLFSAYRDLISPLPAQTLVPLRPDRFFKEISDAFNQAEDVGIVFNSYNVHSGRESVYLNKRARNVLGVGFGERNQYRDRTTYRRITPDAVRAALWIYEYGAPSDVSSIDGAYYRQAMLSELARARTIYVARPINVHWLGSFPTTWAGREDLKTEVNFNGSYAGERDKITLMNRLIREHALPPKVARGRDYHEIKLVEFEIETQQGYFDYAHESLPVFDRARAAAAGAFSDPGNGRHDAPRRRVTSKRRPAVNMPNGAARRAADRRHR